MSGPVLDVLKTKVVSLSWSSFVCLYLHRRLYLRYYLYSVSVSSYDSISVSIYVSIYIPVYLYK